MVGMLGLHAMMFKEVSHEQERPLNIVLDTRSTLHIRNGVLAFYRSLDQYHRSPNHTNMTEFVILPTRSRVSQRPLKATNSRYRCSMFR